MHRDIQKICPECKAKTVDGQEFAIRCQYCGERLVYIEQYELAERLDAEYAERKDNALFSDYFF